MINKAFKCATALAGGALLVASLAGCGQGVSEGTRAQSPDSLTVGVLFPDTQTPHWENVMWPGVETAIEEECPDCKVLYGNVAGDAAQQQSQADGMLAQGADVLILGPVSGESSATIVENAKAQGVPVIGFASLPEGPISAFVGIDVVGVGEAQATELLSQIQADGEVTRGCVVMLNGDSQTPATEEFIEGRAPVLDDEVEVCDEYFIEDWSSANAQTAMDQAITATGKDRIIGVYAMNDTIAAGAIAAMKSAGFTAPFPPVSGGDADVAGLQRVLVGEQRFDMNARIPDWGAVAAPVALAAARGEDLTAEETIANATVEVPWFTTPPATPITIENLQTEVIDSGLKSYDEICTTDFQAACDAAGLTPAKG